MLDGLWSLQVSDHLRVNECGSGTLLYNDHTTCRTRKTTMMYGKIQIQWPSNKGSWRRNRAQQKGA